MAYIEKRGDMQWRAQVRKKGYPTQSRTFITRADAERWAKETEIAMERAIFVDHAEAETTTFADLVRKFREEFAPEHYRAKGWQHKLKPLEAQFGRYALTAITPRSVAEYRDARLKAPDPRYKDPETAPRVSGPTVKTELDLLSKIFDVAEKEFSIALPHGNPVGKVRKPRDSAGREVRILPGSDEEKRLIAACTADRCPQLLPAFRLAVETAMRQGELMGLCWEDVNLDRRVAILHQTKNGESRGVPLSSTAIATLKELKGDKTTGRVLDGIGHATTLQQAFARACEVAGIKGLTWHGLRHEALSRLGERGDLSVLELAAVSGHKTLQMLKRYTHLQASKLAEKLG